MCIQFTQFNKYKYNLKINDIQLLFDIWFKLLFSVINSPIGRFLNK